LLDADSSITTVPALFASSAVLATSFRLAV
jgi:hypothetical protein